MILGFRVYDFRVWGLGYLAPRLYAPYLQLPQHPRRGEVSHAVLEAVVLHMWGCLEAPSRRPPPPCTPPILSGGGAALGHPALAAARLPGCCVEVFDDHVRQAGVALGGVVAPDGPRRRRVVQPVQHSAVSRDHLAGSRDRGEQGPRGRVKGQEVSRDHLAGSRNRRRAGTTWQGQGTGGEQGPAGRAKEQGVSRDRQAGSRREGQGRGRSQVFANSKAYSAQRLERKPTEPLRRGASRVFDIKLLTSFDGGDIQQESWSWVGSRGWDCSE